MNGFSPAQSAALQNVAYQNQGASNAAERTTEMDNLCNRLASSLDHAANLAARLSILEQRLTGGSVAKSETAASPPRPVPNGHIMRMNMGFDELMARFDDALLTVSRLGDAI